MKEYIIQLLRESEWQLDSMQKSKMTLSDRIAYEKVKQKMEIARQLLAKFNVQ